MPQAAKAGSAANDAKYNIFKQAVTGPNWATNSDLPIRISGFVWRYIVPCSGTKITTDVITTWYQTYGPPADSGALLYKTSGNTGPMAQALSRGLDRLLSETPAWGGTFASHGIGQTYIGMKEDDSGKGITKRCFAIRCTLEPESSKFTPWHPAGVDDENLMLVTTLQNEIFHPDTFYFKVRNPAQSKGVYSRRAYETMEEHPDAMLDAIGPLLARMTNSGAEAEFEFTMATLAEDDALGPWASLGDLGSSTSADLRAGLNKDWLVGVDGKKARQAVKTIPAPASFLEFLQSDASGWTICLAEPTLLPFDLAGLCSILSDPACRIGDDTVFFIPIRSVLIRAPRDDAGTFSKLELVSALPAFRAAHNAGGAPSLVRIGQDTGLAGRRLETFGKLMGILHLNCDRDAGKYRYHDCAKLGDWVI